MSLLSMLWSAKRMPWHLLHVKVQLPYCLATISRVAVRVHPAVATQGVQACKWRNACRRASGATFYEHCLIATMCLSVRRRYPFLALMKRSSTAQAVQHVNARESGVG